MIGSLPSLDNDLFNRTPELDKVTSLEVCDKKNQIFSCWRILSGSFLCPVERDQGGIKGLS